MKYPMMLYKGDPVYTDSAQLSDALFSKAIKTFIVADEEQEAEKRSEGWVDFPSLMAPRKVLTLPTKEKPIDHFAEAAALAAKVEAPRTKRKYTRRAA